MGPKGGEGLVREKRCYLTGAPLDLICREGTESWDDMNDSLWTGGYGHTNRRAQSMGRERERGGGMGGGMLVLLLVMLCNTHHWIQESNGSDVCIAQHSRAERSRH